MRCQRVQFLYEDYVAGILPGDSADRIEEHVNTCSVCREYYEMNDELADLILKSNEICHPGDVYLEELSGRVIRSLKQQGCGHKTIQARLTTCDCQAWRQPLYWAGSAAAIALVILAFQGQPLIDASPEEASAEGRAAQLIALAPPIESNRANQGHSANPQGRIARSGSAVQPVSINNSFGGARPVIVSTPNPDGGHDISKSVRQIEADARAAQADNRERAFSMMTGQAHTPADEGQLVADPAPTPGQSRINFSITFSPAGEEQTLVLGAVDSAHVQEQFLHMIREADPQNLGADSAQQLQLIEQANQFKTAEAALYNGEPRRAVELFEQLIASGAHNQLTARAHYLLAHAYYDYFSDHAKAYHYYQICASPEVQGAMSEQERTSVERRLVAMETLSRDGWRPLKQLEKLRSAPWPASIEAFEELRSSPEAGYLLPELARVICQRIKDGDPIHPDHTPGLIAKLRDSAASSTDAAAQGWMHLAVGEIRLNCLNDPGAREDYLKVQQVDPTSPRAQIAIQRLSQIDHMATDRSRDATQAQ